MLKARNILIKANVTKDIRTLNKIKPYILEAKEIEIEILSLVERQL